MFTSLDLDQNNHQNLIPDNVPKTAFRLLCGHYQFKVLNFGFINAFATFQGMMSRYFQQQE